MSTNATSLPFPLNLLLDALGWSGIFVHFAVTVVSYALLSWPIILEADPDDGGPPQEQINYFVIFIRRVLRRNLEGERRLVRWANWRLHEPAIEVVWRELRRKKNTAVRLRVEEFPLDSERGHVTTFRRDALPLEPAAPDVDLALAPAVHQAATWLQVAVHHRVHYYSNPKSGDYIVGYYAEGESALEAVPAVKDPAFTVTLKKATSEIHIPQAGDTFVYHFQSRHQLYYVGDTGQWQEEKREFGGRLERAGKTLFLYVDPVMKTARWLTIPTIESYRRRRRG